MSDVPQGPGWWQANDGRWYPPSGPPTDAPQYPPPQAPQYPPPPGNYQIYRTPMPGQMASGLPDVQGLAVTSLVLGICGLASCLFCALGLVLSLVGLPLGIVALVRINRGRADPRAKGVAVAGIVTNAVSLALAIGIVAVVIVGASTSTTP